jgi:hypothetical protein
VTPVLIFASDGGTKAWRGPTIRTVRTVDAGAVSAMRRAWNRPGRWIEIRARPAGPTDPPDAATVWIIRAGRVRIARPRPSGAPVGTAEPIIATIQHAGVDSPLAILRFQSARPRSLRRRDND